MSKVTSTSNTTDSSTSTTEANIYDYLIETFYNSLSSVNTLDTNTQSSIQSEVDAYKQLGIDEINDAYNSSLKDLQSDSASRFGNLDNSIFADNLSDLESERADSVSTLAQSIAAKQSGLKSDALDENYSLVNLLSNLITNYYDVITTINDSNTAAKTTSIKNDDEDDVSSLITTLLGNNSTSSKISTLLSYL